MNAVIRKTAIATILFFSIFFTAGAFAADFDEIVVFGDSLSDDGNLLFFEDQSRPDPEIYYQGRLSNGPVWVEYLVDPELLDVSKTAIALGGAQTDGLTPPGLLEQVSTYIAAETGSLSGDSLFILWAGSNDFLNGDGDYQEAVDNINTAMDRLVEFGAEHILVLNLPDLGTIPKTLGTADAAEATEFTLNFNAELANMLDEFSVEHPEVGLYTFDAYGFFMEIRNNPAAFGFTNVTEPSPNFSIENNFEGAGHLFWDERHPTTAAHALLADRVFADLNAQLPESTDTDDDDDDSSNCFINTFRW
ncbi:MAG: SGNH/GDSL hydrolase family protein [Desulfococcaceae bacterium]